MEGEVDIAPIPPRREAETGDGVRAPPEMEFDGGVLALPAVVVAESSVGVEAPVSQRLRKRKRVRVEEEEDDEPESISLCDLTCLCDTSSTKQVLKQIDHLKLNIS